MSFRSMTAASIEALPANNNQSVNWKEIEKAPAAEIQQQDVDLEFVKSVPATEINGASRINAVQLVWGKHGKKIVILG